MIPTSPISPYSPNERDYFTQASPSSPPPFKNHRPHLGRNAPSLGSRTSSTSSILKLNHLLPEEEDHGADTYDVCEVRDGFFDAVFLKPPCLPSEDDIKVLKTTLPATSYNGNSLTIQHLLRNQWHALKIVIREILTTYKGIKLFKFFLAYMIAYILCLVPGIRHWLGHEQYIMAVSVIINHPARTLGAQLDGTILTILGTASGIAWGAVALLLSTSTPTARAGYGGILALFLILFVAFAAWIRAIFVRFYPAVICAGIAIFFTTLAEAHSSVVPWPKLRGYAISFLLGQLISLLVNVLILPDAGARSLVKPVHESLQAMQEVLSQPYTRDAALRRRLSNCFVDLSEAYRDLAMDITISRFRPQDILRLRNLLQAVLRALLSMNTDACILHGQESKAYAAEEQSRTDHGSHRVHLECMTTALSKSTRQLVQSMREGILGCDAALMDISGYRNNMGPAMDISSNVTSLKIRLGYTIAEFDRVESSLLPSDSLLYSDSFSHSTTCDSEFMQLFAFAKRVREAAVDVMNLLSHVGEMQSVDHWPRLRWPSYPLSKAVYRANAQVRHDRGGVVAVSYQVTFDDIARLLDKITSRTHKPMSRMKSKAGETNLKPELKSETSNNGSTRTTADDVKVKTSKKRYKIWRFLHRLQGFEGKYALKACLVTSVLSIPSYLHQSKEWWDKYEVWWAVAMSWVVVHPRVGGNPQDLLNRSCLAILGAVWAGAGYAAGQGNPYIMAVFAAVYMMPMLYRYLSSHPRSGLVGSLSFTVVSLSLLDDYGGRSTPAVFTAYRSLVFFVGTAGPILVTWILWPFVARHELRSSLSSMLFFMSVTYRSVVATYVYFEDDHAPTPADVERSELLEARLREGFVRIHQLLGLTRHELRLRAPFDPVPFSALAESCERFLEHLVAVRQSALCYNSSCIRDHCDGPTAAQRLLPFRRDAVAAVLANLYILAGALRSHRKVPRHLPSAAAARKALLVQSDKVEAELVAAGATSSSEELDLRRRWNDMYRFSYNQSLTGCIVELENMEKYTKFIVGEQGFADQFSI